MSDEIYSSQSEKGIITQSHISIEHANSQHFPFAISEDEMFKWHSMSDGYVCISCHMSGLPDNSIGKTGWHIDYLQYSELSEEWRLKAVAFWQTVHNLKHSREDNEVKKKIDEIEALIEKDKEMTSAKIETAQAIGKKVLISSWLEECNDPQEECSMDDVCKWAMPNGTIEITRTHTW